MDKSNFDVVKCDHVGCPYWHIIITEGFQSQYQAQQEIKNIIDGTSFYSMGNKQIKRLEMIKLHQDACKQADSKRPNPTAVNDNNHTKE